MIEETRQRIESGLADWQNPNSEARKRFEAYLKDAEERMRPYRGMIRRSMVITQEDLQKTITI